MGEPARAHPSDRSLTLPLAPPPFLVVVAVCQRPDLRRAAGPDLPAGQGHRCRQHLPRYRGWLDQPVGEHCRTVAHRNVRMTASRAERSSSERSSDCHQTFD
eukprot:357461-Chlamydomonas_euryale.AAC.1